MGGGWGGKKTEDRGQRAEGRGQGREAGIEICQAALGNDKIVVSKDLAGVDRSGRGCNPRPAQTDRLEVFDGGGKKKLTWRGGGV